MEFSLAQTMLQVFVLPRDLIQKVVATFWIALQEARMLARFIAVIGMGAIVSLSLVLIMMAHP